MAIDTASAREPAPSFASLLERWGNTGAGGSWINKDPDFDELRDEPRFRALLERIERQAVE